VRFVDVGQGYREAREQHEQREAGDDDPITRIIRSRVPLGSIRRVAPSGPRICHWVIRRGNAAIASAPAATRRDGDENSRRGAGNISGRTSRGLTKPYGAERPRRTPRRSRANVAVSTRRAAPYRSRVRRGARRRRARTPVRRRGGSPRPGAVPRRVPVGPEPREADHGDRRSDESDTDPAEQRRDEDPSLKRGLPRRRA